MQFNDIINQENVKQQLRSFVQQNRLSHALLFLGKEGNGALPLAIAFAQYMVCERVSRNSAPDSDRQSQHSLFGENSSEPDESIVQLPFDSCGECPSCKKAAQLIHPDIHFSYP